MGNIFYRCPKCQGTSLNYDYGRKMIVCAKCKTLLKDFEMYLMDALLQKL